MTYPNINKATLLITLDNGGINRGRTTQERQDAYETWLAYRPTVTPGVELGAIDEWLGALTETELNEVCCGCYGEEPRSSLMAGAPPGTEELLDAYFEEVC